MRIAMLGLGSMNAAILSGLLAGPVSREDVVATTRSSASAAARAEELGVEVLAEESDAEANCRAVDGADVVLLGVKPHGIVTLAEEIAEALAPQAVVVSVAAAVDVAMLESALREGQPAIRSMPNTPLSVGQGVVGLAAGTHATAEQVETVQSLLSACGAVHVVDEVQIDALTGVSGSGPAYAFLLAEHMAAGGVELGLDPELAADLAAATVRGAGTMLVEHRAAGTADAAALRRAVCSPNGTTERAVDALEAHEVPAAVRAAVAASASRAREMTTQLRGEV